jgi:uncharacterized protein (DUF1778 family)
MKDDHITFRASTEIKELIKKKAHEAGLTVSSYIITCCLSGTKYKITTTTETTTEIEECK